MKLLKKAKNITEALIKNIGEKRLIMEGFKIVICGKQNAGKSSLCNCILDTSRSIVNKLPGTQYTYANGNLKFEFTVEPKCESHFEIIYKDSKVEYIKKESLKNILKVASRRYLCLIRDLYLCKFSVLSLRDRLLERYLGRTSRSRTS